MHVLFANSDNDVMFTFLVCWPFPEVDGLMFLLNQPLCFVYMFVLWDVK